MNVTLTPICNDGPTGQMKRNPQRKPRAITAAEFERWYAEWPQAAVVDGENTLIYGRALDCWYVVREQR